MQKGKVIIGVTLLLLLLGAGCLTLSKPDISSDTSPKESILAEEVRLMELLSRFHEETLNRLNLLDQAVHSASVHATAVGPDDPSTHEVLAYVAMGSESVIDVISFDTDGLITDIYPTLYASSLGADLSNSSHIRFVLDENKPVLSDVFTSVEGPDASVIAFPVYHPNGTIAGGISALFSSAELIGEAAGASGIPSPYFAKAVTVDGMIIYDPVKEEIGTTLFSDPRYTISSDLELFLKRIGTEREGVAIVDLYGIQKHIVWDTVSLHGTDWRLLIEKSL